MAHYKYLVIPIVPADSGFGEWDRSPYTRKARSIKEAVKILTDEVEDRAIELPNESFLGEDITGLIHDETSRVFAYNDAYGGYGYFGLEHRG